MILVELTSFVFGLGVFGIVDVTAIGTGVVACVRGAGCCSVFCGFNEILNEFSFKRPFAQNCIESGFWVGKLFVTPV